MAKIGLIDVDGHNFPNLALMKLAAYHRAQGDDVEMVEPLYWDYDRIYASKVFTFTPDIERSFGCEIIRGGTGYDIHSRLPEEIDRMQPDYSIYPDVDRRTAYGFLTRGCPNHCPWCVVPEKEGAAQPYMDIEEIAVDGRKRIILMDNNILALPDYAAEQFEKMIRLGLRVDFNQALDARRITPDLAGLMARMKWIDYIRFGCDTALQIAHCENAIALLRSKGYSGRFFLYCILNEDFHESFERIDYWHRKADWKIHPYAQPYRNPFQHGRTTPYGSATSIGGATERSTTSHVTSGSSPRVRTSHVKPTSTIPQWQRDLAQWTNRHGFYEACDFRDFSPRKNFTCAAYLQDNQANPR